MRDFKRLTEWVNPLVVTGAVLTSNYFKLLFAKLGADSWYLIGPVLLSVIGIKAADIATKAIVERVRPLRQLLAGENYIEGEWVNIVINAAKPENVIAAEFCTIRYRGGQYVVSGDTWSLDGAWMSNFSTEGSSYRGRELEYYYKTGVRKLGGFGIIKFTPEDSVPTEFICQYLDETSEKPHITYGEKSSGKFRKLSMGARRDLALKFVADCQQTRRLAIESVLGLPAPSVSKSGTAAEIPALAASPAAN